LSFCTKFREALRFKVWYEFPLANSFGGGQKKEKEHKKKEKKN